MTEYDIDTDGHTETLAPDADGTAYYSFVATDVNGPDVTVRSRGGDGFVSAPARWAYAFHPWPGVTSDIDDDQDPDPTGGVGVTGTFTFTPPPGWTDVAAYRYWFADDQSDQSDVAAGADGRATITWTPAISGFITLTVYAGKADGTLSDYADYYSFQVA